MRDKPDDSPTLAEKMNRGMGLDPGFTLERPDLVDVVREKTDETVKRAQANVDQQRHNAADVARIAKEMEREAKSKAAAGEEHDAPAPDISPNDA